MFIIMMVMMIAVIGYFSWFVIQFVVINRPMFEATFNIVVQFPLFPWKHTWQEASFTSIIVASVLLGAVVVAIGVFGSDVKGWAKRRSMKKEIARLQKELQELRTQHQQIEQAQEQEEEKRAQMAAAIQPAEEIAAETAETVATPEFDNSSSATPEEISKSFEGAVQRTDFFSQPAQPDSEEKMPEESVKAEEEVAKIEEPAQPSDFSSQPQPDSEEKMPEEEVTKAEENLAAPLSPDVEETTASETPSDAAQVQEEGTTGIPLSSQEKPRKNDE